MPYTSLEPIEIYESFALDDIMQDVCRFVGNFWTGGPIVQQLTTVELWSFYCQRKEGTHARWNPQVEFRDLQVVLTEAQAFGNNFDAKMHFPSPWELRAGIWELVLSL